MQTAQTIPEPFLHASRIAFRRIHGLDLANAGAPGVSIDSSQLLLMARKHRMLGILYAGLPRDALPEWRKYALGQAQLSVRFFEQAAQITDRLSKALHTPPTLIKGPGLALQAWPDPALRTFDDLDFRCRREDFSTFSDVVGAAGYKPLMNNGDHNEHLWHFGWGVGFRHIDGYYLEVNHRLFPRHFPCPPLLAPPHNALPAKLQMLDDSTVLCPTPAAHLVLASAHAFWHGGERLAWIADIAGLLIRHPGIMVDARKLCAGYAFLSRALLAACMLASQLFGPGLAGWDDAEKSVSGEIDQRIRESCRIYRQQLLAATQPVPKERRRLQGLLCSRQENIRGFVLRAVTPGEPDFASLALHKQQRNRYWLYRPLRLLSRRRGS